MSVPGFEQHMPDCQQSEFDPNEEDLSLAIIMKTTWDLEDDTVDEHSTYSNPFPMKIDINQ